jgi:hypothetical protein
MPCGVIVPFFDRVWWSLAALTTFALARTAHAESENSGRSPSPEPAPPMAWSLTANAGVGVGDAGVAGRVGIDAAYWLSPNLGLGAQFGFQSVGTVTLWPDDEGSSAHESRFSFAPAFVVRGSNPISFPVVSVALGYSWGHSDSEQYCDPANEVYEDCSSGAWSGDASGLYGSLGAAWMFHFGRPRPSSVAFTLGPSLRLDWLTYDDFFDAGFGFEKWSVTLTTGITIGFDVVSRQRPYDWLALGSDVSGIR